MAPSLASVPLLQKLSCLFADRLYYFGRAMAEAVHCHAGYEIEVFVSRCVPDMHALALDEGYRIASISGGDVAISQLDNLFIHL